MPALLTFFRRALLVCALAAPGCAAPEAPVHLTTTGGDTWTFDKTVEGSVPAGRCDAVAFTSPRGTVIARPKDGHVAAHVPLTHGDNPIEVECRANGVRQGAAAYQDWYVPLRAVPRAEARATITEDGLALDGSASRPAPGKAATIVSYEWHARDGNPAPIAGLPRQGEQITIAPPSRDGRYYVTLRTTGAQGRSDESTVAFRVRDGAPEIVDSAREHPAWVDRAVIYGVVPFFFGPRGLPDVTARLDDLAALGVTVLWLSPITESAEGDFGYAVTDHFQLRPDFGTEADLHALIDGAHARGLRVIMDFVPNHMAAEHRYFSDAKARGRRSPYYRYFVRASDGTAANYFDWANLKNLDYHNPEVQRLIIEAFAHWVREFDIDGFRVDVAWGPRRRAPEFWPRWRAELKRIKPDLLLLAEASARDPYYVHNGFDAAYDWTDALGIWAWHVAFEDEAHTAAKLRDAIAASDGDGLVFRFLNNNDTGPRFVSRYGLDRTRVATAMLLTLPGLPELYSGDEIGAEFKPYDEGPPITWEKDKGGLRDWHRRLIALRRDTPALYGRGIRLLDAPDPVLAYVRPGASPVDDVLVLLNYGAAPVRVDLPPDIASGRLTDLLDGSRPSLDRGRALTLPAHGVRILGQVH